MTAVRSISVHRFLARRSTPREARCGSSGVTSGYHLEAVRIAAETPQESVVVGNVLKLHRNRTRSDSAEFVIIVQEHIETGRVVGVVAVVSTKALRIDQVALII